MLADFSVARDPSKRRVKPTPTVELFPLTLESESEDSDFKIEDGETDGDDSDSASLSSSSSDALASENEETIADSEQLDKKNGLEAAGFTETDLLICKEELNLNFF